MKILLVEDDAGDARRIRELLLASEACACELVPATSVAGARAALAAGGVDLVLLDLSLPDASGLDALAQVIAAAAWVPIIVLTGVADEELALGAVREGAQDFLVKGAVAPDLLVRAMRYARERKRLQQAERVLAEAGRLLAGSLDYEETLQSVGQLAVRFLADFCVIDIAEEGTLRRLHVAHLRAEDAPVAERLLRFPIDHTRPTLVARVVESRQPVLIGSVDDTLLRSLAQSDEHLDVMRALRPRSYMAVPMIAHERLVGTLVFIHSGREFDEADVALAEKLGNLAALEVENARLYRSAREALRTRDRVLGFVAHDLRSPLSTIAMGVDLLLDLEMSAEMRANQLHTIRRTADRMDRLIQDLLDVGRMEADRLMLQREPLDPARLAREAVELNAMLASARSLSLAGETPSLDVHVDGDRDRLLRVLTNLIDNAIKFTPRGGRVTVSVAHERGEVVFRVRDTGPGIPADHLPLLFQPFWQARRESTEGAGLGLAIARGIVEAHGGRIWAESEPGHGATVCFTLPVAEERRGSGEG